MVDVNVEFTLSEDNPVEANFTVQPDVEYTADIKVETAIKDHEQLENRDLPDQHPIEAITDLRDILNRVWTFTFEQEIPSAVWVITHNLGRNPSIVAVDSAGNAQIPDEVTYNSENQMTVQFISAFAGKAYLN